MNAYSLPKPYLPTFRYLPTQFEGSPYKGDFKLEGYDTCDNEA